MKCVSTAAESIWCSSVHSSRGAPVGERCGQADQDAACAQARQSALQKLNQQALHLRPGPCMHSQQGLQHRASLQLHRHGSPKTPGHARHLCALVCNSVQLQVLQPLLGSRRRARAEPPGIESWPWHARSCYIRPQEGSPTRNPGGGHKAHEESNEGQNLGHVHAGSGQAKPHKGRHRAWRQVGQSAPHDHEQPVAGQPSHLRAVQAVS